MTDIQVDMFEVQLGAALLIQMRDSAGKSVRLLADAGINAPSPYARDHVANKLPQALSTFAHSGESRIDLMVGTHYDQDHLAGLIDVTKQFPVGEALLPPVRTPAVRRDQMQEAADTNDLVAPLELDALPPPADEEPSTDTLNSLAEYCQAVEHAAAQRLDFIVGLVRGRQSSETVDRFLKEVDAYVDDLEESVDEFDPDEPHGVGSYLAASTLDADLSTAAKQVAAIKKSAIMGAIVARWLNQLVTALKKNGVPIKSLTIPHGVPEYYEWDGTHRKFKPVSAAIYAASKEPKFTLLGPSKTLVNHHATKIPLGMYLVLGGHILKRPVRPSNQLSYVLLVESGGQQILITGDSGCVDFYDRISKGYFPALVSALKEPNVVQIAHHAGSNAHFYDALLASNFARSSAPAAFLMLSHGYHDQIRPTVEFKQFVTLLSSKRSNFCLLFTSEPQLSKVSSFTSRIHGLVGTSSKRNVGDVRLSYNARSWTVDHHCVMP